MLYAMAFHIKVFGEFYIICRKMLLILTPLSCYYIIPNKDIN